MIFIMTFFDQHLSQDVPSLWTKLNDLSLGGAGLRPRSTVCWGGKQTSGWPRLICSNQSRAKSLRKHVCNSGALHLRGVLNAFRKVGIIPACFNHCSVLVDSWYLFHLKNLGGLFKPKGGLNFWRFSHLFSKGPWCPGTMRPTWVGIWAWVQRRGPKKTIPQLVRSYQSGQKSPPKTFTNAPKSFFHFVCCFFKYLTTCYCFFGLGQDFASKRSRQPVLGATMGHGLVKSSSNKEAKQRGFGC